VHEPWLGGQLENDLRMFSLDCYADLFRLNEIRDSVTVVSLHIQVILSQASHCEKFENTSRASFTSEYIEVDN
jgi:hypothetical protein